MKWICDKIFMLGWYTLPKHTATKTKRSEFRSRLAVKLMKISDSW